MEKKSRIRFTYEDELIVLREFVTQNPICAPEKWEVILQHIQELTGKQFMLRTLKKHIKLLVDLFHKKEDYSKVKSGIEEPYSERDHLLQDASDMMKEALTLTPTKKRKLEPVEKQLCEQARQKREAVALHAFMANNSKCLAETLGDHDYVPEVSKLVEIESTNLDKDQEEAKVMDGGSTNINSSMTNSNTAGSSTGAVKQVLGPCRKRTNKSKPMRRNALDYLKEKAERDKEIRLKELALEEVRLNNEQRKLAIEEQKIALETQRLNMEIAERNQKMEIERQRFQNDMDEKKKLTELINSQRKLIDRLLTKSGEDKD